MSRPGDESTIGSTRYRQRSQHLRQLAVTSGRPFLDIAANIRRATLIPTANGDPLGDGRPVSTIPVPHRRSASPTFICRCSDDDEILPVPVPPRPPGAHNCPGVESLRPELAAILAELRCITRKMHADDLDDEQTKEWKFAAMVIDRLSFWTLTVYLVIVTVAVFGTVLRT